MKYSLLLLTILLVQAQVQATDNKNFKPWCDTFTAESLVSLAANRIYGNITGLSKEEYKKRSEWVNQSYKQSEKRFKKITGLNFQDTPYRQEWIDKCQLKDQIL